MLKHLFMVGLGGMLGSMLRYAISMKIQFAAFPLATFVINVVGSFLLGFLLGWGNKNNITPYWLLFLGSGFCGGFTTFSAFSVEMFSLLEEGKIYTCIAYGILSLILGVTAAFLGYYFSR